MSATINNFAILVVSVDGRRECACVCACASQSVELNSSMAQCGSECVCVDGKRQMFIRRTIWPVAFISNLLLLIKLILNLDFFFLFSFLFLGVIPCDDVFIDWNSFMIDGNEVIPRSNRYFDDKTHGFAWQSSNQTAGLIPGSENLRLGLPGQNRYRFVSVNLYRD